MLGRGVCRAGKLAAFVATLALALIAPPAEAAPVIAAAGDIACAPSNDAFNGGNGTSGQCRQRYTSDLLVGAGLSAVLPLGDNQYEDGTLSEFRGGYDRSWGRVKSITRPAIGNHERGGSGYYDYFNGVRATNGLAGPRGKGYYSFDIGSWHLIALNTNDQCSRLACRRGSPQERWLKADLAAHPAVCTLAYWHEPLFSSKTRYTSGSAFWSNLYDAGAEIVLNGHVHNYERFAPQTPSGKASSKGIRQFVVGTGGYSLESSGRGGRNSQARLSTFGVLKLTLYPAGYDWQFVMQSGSVTDAGSGQCRGAGGAPAPTPSPPAPPPLPADPGAVQRQTTGELPRGAPAALVGAGHETSCTIVGTGGRDVLIGTRERDVICGLDGNDVIRGGAGRDLILAGGGDDRIYGQRGGDVLVGRSGDDRLSGGGGLDRMFGNAGRDRLFALDHKGGELVVGGRGRDRARADRRDRVQSARRASRSR